MAHGREQGHGNQSPLWYRDSRNLFDDADQDSLFNDSESSIILSSVSSDYHGHGQGPPGANHSHAIGLEGGAHGQAPAGSAQAAHHQQVGNYKKLHGRHNANYLQLKASWLQETSKSVCVDIDENETVLYLLRKIGERMEETHDEFRGLRRC